MAEVSGCAAVVPNVDDEEELEDEVEMDEVEDDEEVVVFEDAEIVKFCTSATVPLT
jgi:hypothetical protein